MNAVEATFYDGRTSRGHAVTLRFEPDGLRLAGAGEERLFPRSQVRVESPLGRTRRFIRLPEGQRCEVADNEALDRALAAWGGQPWSNWRHRLEGSWRWVALATVVLLGFGWLGVRYGLPAAARQVAYALPENLTDQLGRDTLAMLDRTVFKPSGLDQERQRELQDKFAAFLQAAGEVRAYRIVFRAAPRLGANALALPSGEIVMTDALVELAEDDRELLAVLAHECGHIRHRHALRAVLQNSAVVVLFTLVTGDLSTATAVGAALPTFLLQSKFSRLFEADADAYAVARLRAAGIAPHYLADMLDRLSAAAPGTGEGMLDYLGTHPPTRERRRAILGETP